MEKDRENEIGILKRLLWVFCGVFVMFSFSLLSYLAAAFPGYRLVRLSDAGMRLILGGVWLAAAAVVVIVRRQDPLEVFKILTVKSRMQWWALPVNCVLGFLAGASLNRVITLLIALIPFPESWIQKNAESVGSVSAGNPVAVMLSVGIMAPVLEELAFRGKGFYFFEKAVSGFRAGPVITVAVTSLLFAAAHGNMLQSIYAFACGVLFALFMKNSGSVVPGILAHSGFNLANLLFYTFYSAKPEMDSVLAAVCFVLLPVSAAATVIIGRIIRGRGAEEPEDARSIYISGGNDRGKGPGEGSGHYPGEGSGGDPVDALGEDPGEDLGEDTVEDPGEDPGGRDSGGEFFGENGDRKP